MCLTYLGKIKFLILLRFVYIIHKSKNLKCRKSITNKYFQTVLNYNHKWEKYDRCMVKRGSWSQSLMYVCSRQSSSCRVAAPGCATWHRCCEDAEQP